MHFPGRIISVVAALMTAAQLFSCSGPESEKDPVKEEPSVTPQPPSPGGQEEAKAPRADLLDVVFSSDGSARDVSAKGMSVRYVPGPALATYSNDAYGRVVAAFTRKMGVSVSDGFYRIDYKDDKAFRDALADGHSLEVVFKANHTSDGSAEVKVFSSHQSGGTGFLISTSARGTQFNFLPNVSSDGKSKWIWTPCGFTPKAGVYYHAVGVWNKKEGKGLMYVSKMLHAVMNVADKEGVFDFDSLQGVHWKKKELGSVNKYKTLTELQCKKLEAMKVIDLPRNPKSELYRDFCIFLLYTGQSPCDAITLQYSDIENIRGIDHFIFKRRKIEDKQAVPCAVPINKSMRRIMNRWKNEAKDGYVFPIRNKWKLENQKTSNGDIKHFISRTNTWLKEVAKNLKCDFSLHLYTFRHTAITRYISNGIPVTYVANLMGTSVKNCEQIYYNNQGDIASRDKVLSLLI